MINILFYTSWILNILLALLKKKSKILTILTLFLSVYVMSVSTGSKDYWYFSGIYNGTHLVTLEYGYGVLMRFCCSMGMNFTGFMWFTTSLSFAIVMYVFSRYSDNFQLFFALYLIYEYAIDGNQVRNFLASSLLLLSLHFLIKDKKWAMYIFLALSVSIHLTMFFYVPIFLFNSQLQKNKKILKFGVCTIVLLCVGLRVLGSRFEFVGIILNSVVGSINITDKSSYFTVSTHMGFLLYYFLYGAIVFVFIYAKKVIKGQNVFNRTGCFNNALDIIETVDYYVMLCFPLIIINMNFYRLYRNIYILNLIFTCVAADSFTKRSKEYYRFLLCAFSGSLLYRIPIVHGSSLLRDLLDATKN